MRFLLILPLILGFLPDDAFARERIAVIGAGGAGLAAAWLLEDRYDVVLIERNARVGGHAETVFVESGGQRVPVEAGFEFFNGRIHPLFNRYLELLGLQVREYPLTYTFTWSKEGRTLFLPPIGSGGGFGAWSIPYLLEFARVLLKGDEVLDSGPAGPTLGAWARENASSGFRKRFLLPFAASLWGVSIDDAREFDVYPVMKWLKSTGASGLAPPVFREIVGGTSAYAERVAGSLGSAELLLETEALALERKEQGYAITTSRGSVIEADQLVVATEAFPARRLLETLKPTSAAAREAHASLSRFESYRTTIAVHGDPSVMPSKRKDWGNVNIRFDGERAVHTVLNRYSPDGTPVFKTWVSHEFENGEPLPRPLHAVRQYWHPRLTPEFFVAQREIEAMQGRDGLWLAGMYLGDLDSHESAILSAVRIARRLNPASPRLRALLAGAGE